MHLLLIPSWYPTASNPIPGVFFREQALALQKAGHRVGVLVAPTLRSVRGLAGVRSVNDLAVSISTEEDRGLMTYRTSVWAWFGRLLPAGNTWLRARAGLRAFARYLQEQGRPDIVHAHSILYGGYLAVQIRKHWQIPVVLTEHSSAFLRDLIRPHQERIVRYTLQHADRRLAVSEALASALRPHAAGQPIEVLGNMVDTDFFFPVQADTPPSGFVFATVASLSPQKGLDVLLQAFALAFRGEGVLLRIGGDGDQRGVLEQRAHELGIGSQVEFLGQLSREEVRSLLQQTHVLVSSSYVETFGITLIEAMSCGKPVIATRSGGPELLLQEHNGLLVPPGDAASLAGAMEAMVRDYHRYDPGLIRAGCVARFSEQAAIRRLDQIYDGLTSSHREDSRLRYSP